jgi:hypothetical protein
MRQSVFKLNATMAAAVAGKTEMVVTWESRPGLFYALDRVETLKLPFVTMTNGIKGMPPMNRYTDSVDQAISCMFYRIGQEE